MKCFCYCAVVMLSLISFEGVSFAQTTALLPWTQATMSVAAWARPGISLARAESIVLHASGDVREDSSANDSAEVSEVDDGDSFIMPLGGAVAGLRLCHISHHPRDGVRADLHACPLLVAEAETAVPSTPNAAVALRKIAN
jgi:hypothetical protein